MTNFKPPSERVNAPISDAELERRWLAVRKKMEEAKIDVLLIQSDNNYMGGYSRYFTDIPAVNGYPVTMIFPRDDRMTLIRPAGFGSVANLPPEGDMGLRGVKQVLGSPYFVSAYYTADYDGELAAKALAPYAKATVGLVGMQQISVSLMDYLRKHLPNVRFVDATDLVDRVKCVKSEEEKTLIRGTAKMQDGAIAAAFAAIRPGMRDSDVSAVARDYSHRHGSEQGIYLCASFASGKPFPIAQHHDQNKIIQPGDYVAFLVEDSGPGGYYAEMGRVAVLGKATDDMQEELDFALKARRLTLSMLKPGASCKDIWESYNTLLRENGRSEEKRIYCHGQGYDLVERPLVRFDEPAPLAEGMNIVIHPAWVRGKALGWVCDNYFVEANGPSARLHQYPEAIIELG